MLQDGVTFLQGSSAHNFTIEHGTTLPSSPVDGQLYRLTSTNGEYFPALYWYNVTTTKWITSDIHTITAGDGLTATETNGVVSISITSGAGGGINQAGVNISGNVQVFNGVARWYPPKSITLIDITSHVNTAPTTNTTIIDLLKNGTSVLTGTYPTISIGSNNSNTVLLTTTLTTTDYLTVNITSAGGSADMYIQIRYQ